jgi:TRAP-type C4-dicarboxylate transport system permease small subunit
MRKLYHKDRILFWLVAASAALYVLFAIADVFGVRYTIGMFSSVINISSDVLKYVSVCVCFFVSAIVARRTPYKRDAWLQVGVFAFTLVADYLILFTPHFTAGVLVFCCAHIVAIDRYAGFEVVKKMAFAIGGVAVVLIIALLIYSYVSYAPVSNFEHSESLDLALMADKYSLPIAAVLYAILIFAVTAAAFTRRQAHMNNILSRTGMVLFLLCDINVLLWNLRLQAGFTEIPEWTITLVWLFYLPGQTALALSAYGFE